MQKNTEIEKKTSHPGQFRNATEEPRQGRTVNKEAEPTMTEEPRGNIDAIDPELGTTVAHPRESRPTTTVGKRRTSKKENDCAEEDT